MWKKITTCDKIEVSEELAKRILITIEDYAYELEMDLEKVLR